MMKRLLLLAIGIGALTACAAQAPAPAPAPVQDTAADEAAMKAEAGVWFDHFNKGDADAIAALYAEDALVLPDKAPAKQGRAAFREYIAGEIAGMKAAGLSFKDGGPNGAGVSGDLGWISGTFSVVDASGKAVDTGKYMSVHRKIDGKWLYIRDIWNSDTAPAPPAAAPKK